VALCFRKKQNNPIVILPAMSDSILDIALQTIRIEAAALHALADTLGHTDHFERSVRAIFAAQGRLVVTGIGKSAIVAQKIVATLNSTGQPALFLHAADAIHGDLGMIQPADLVLCISKSGESPEIKVLLPLVRNFGNPIIGMTARRTSFLAKNSDYVLWTPIDQEADPNGLAPTSSTTAQMALGDALAVSLLALRGFSADQFAQFHPGGTLGKQLYLRVRDLAERHDKPAVSLDASLPEVLLEISTRRLGATAVLDAAQRVAGIITDGDLRRMLGRKQLAINELTARDLLTSSPVSIGPDALAIDALGLLRERSITQVLVLDEAGTYLGMVHLHDLVREGLI
jgi:arabinose-5-phosphate isomerase